MKRLLLSLLCFVPLSYSAGVLNRAQVDSIWNRIQFYANPAKAYLESSRQLAHAFKINKAGPMTYQLELSIEALIRNASGSAQNLAQKELEKWNPFKRKTLLSKSTWAAMKGDLESQRYGSSPDFGKGKKYYTQALKLDPQNMNALTALWESEDLLIKPPIRNKWIPQLIKHQFLSKVGLKWAKWQLNSLPQNALFVVANRSEEIALRIAQHLGVRPDVGLINLERSNQSTYLKMTWERLQLESIISIPQEGSPDLQKQVLLNKLIKAKQVQSIKRPFTISNNAYKMTHSGLLEYMIWHGNHLFWSRGNLAVKVSEIFTQMKNMIPKDFEKSIWNSKWNAPEARTLSHQNKTISSWAETYFSQWYRLYREARFQGNVSSCTEILNTLQELPTLQQKRLADTAWRDGCSY